MDLTISNGCMPVGKMNQPHRTAYLTYGGKEHAVAEYEVLCVKEVLDMTTPMYYPM